MSYCRWSSMDWQCDLYVYESVYDCWTIHVAGQRRVGVENIPKLDWAKFFEGEKPDAREFARAHKEQMEALDKLASEPIDLPYAGETFHLATPGECADKIEELLALGYIAPPEIVDELRSEQLAMENGDGDNDHRQ